MSEPEERFQPLTPLEEALASIRPHVAGFDRERLLFLAGQASVQPTPRHGWAWPAACCTMTAVAAALCVALLIRPEANLGGRAEPFQMAQPSHTPVQPVEPPAMADQRGAEPSSVGQGWWLDLFPTRPVDGMASPYARLRDELLQPGGPPHRPRPSMAPESAAMVEQTLPYHKLLERLLENRPLDGTHPRSTLDLN
jgi:hypothetical protein